MTDRKKKLKNEYKTADRRAGVFEIRNLANGKAFVGSTFDLDAIFNRHRFQLDAGLHLNSDLQNDWRTSDGKGFAFGVLEELTNPGADLAAELEFLEDLWLEKLEPFGERGYNTRKMTRGERLEMIAARRRSTI